MAESGEQNRLEQLRKQLAKTRALREQGLKFTTENFPYMTRIKAKIGNETIGYLDLNNFDPEYKGREIRQVTTEDAYQRKGVASSLFNEAKKMGLKPLHSDKLSNEGRQFKEAVGGRSIPAVKQPQSAADLKAFKQMNKSAGRKAAIEIARQRGGQSSAPMRDPVAINQMNKILGRANMGLGALNVAGFLPMLMEAGNIMTGRSAQFDPVRMTR